MCDVCPKLNGHGHVYNFQFLTDSTWFNCVIEKPYYNSLDIFIYILYVHDLDTL